MVAFLVKFLTPTVLGVTMVLTFIKEIKNPYGGYPLSAVLVIGVGTMAVIFISAMVLTLISTESDREYGIE